MLGVLLGSLYLFQSHGQGVSTTTTTTAIPTTTMIPPLLKPDVARVKVDKKDIQFNPIEVRTLSLLKRHVKMFEPLLSTFESLKV